MAFKLNMEQLMSPRSRAEIDAEEAERKQRIQRLIETRTAMVKEIVGLATLTEWEKRFLSSLEFKATTYDVSGIFAGDLATLSEKQIEALDRLYQRVESAPLAGAESIPWLSRPC